jgi:hypothetical protein
MLPPRHENCPFLELADIATSCAAAQQICLCLSDVLRRQADTDDNQPLVPGAI